MLYAFLFFPFVPHALPILFDLILKSLLNKAKIKMCISGWENGQRGRHGGERGEGTWGGVRRTNFLSPL
jgi:hypothetical protein